MSDRVLSRILKRKTGSRVHFVGIGGVGMSAIAELLFQQDCMVTGSDREASALTDRLETLGIPVQIGHTPEAVENADLVVYTPAAGPENRELQAARSKGIPAVKRADILGQLTAGHRIVGVTGTHGKTTATAMVGAVLEAAGLDPTVLVGGIVRGTERNLRPGSRTLWAVEADEFDRSFLTLSPEVAVVTSLEEDHLDTYGNIEGLLRAFQQFLEQTSRSAVMAWDGPLVRQLNAGHLEVFTYGLEDETGISAQSVLQAGLESRFSVVDRRKPLGEIVLRVPGRHNVSNALAAVGVGMALQLPWKAIRTGLENFRGVRRRLETLGDPGGVSVVNDYAHHPTEVRAALETIRPACAGRLIAVFQPHLYSRTRDFAAEFGRALSEADEVWVTDVYAAREDAIPGVSGEAVARHARGAGCAEVFYIPDLQDLEHRLSKSLVPRDLVLVMGAGDVERVAYGLIDRLS
ncbi:MAG: UDP-N-acetylmuramate--L-alanine ligase [Gemmatimonadota bacterium]|nr:UDP-N-acetylmuramate--L-alanine ligase [Gemmatimonadota bacterium]